MSQECPRLSEGALVNGPTELQLMDRYCSQKQRLQDIVDAMHPNMARNTDLDGLDALEGALRKVALKGDRIEIKSAQRVALDAKAAAPAAPLLNPEGAEDLEAEAALLGNRHADLMPPAEEAADAATRGMPPMSAEIAEVKAAAAALRAQHEADAAAPVLVVKQKPPIAKPGRGRGFVYKGDGA